jgi:hypothetical protein
MSEVSAAALLWVSEGFAGSGTCLEKQMLSSTYSVAMCILWKPERMVEIALFVGWRSSAVLCRTGATPNELNLCVQPP